MGKSWVIGGIRLSFYYLMAVILPGYTAIIMILCIFGKTIRLDTNVIYIPETPILRDVLFSTAFLISGPIAGLVLALFGQLIYRLIHIIAKKISKDLDRFDEKVLTLPDRLYSEVFDVWGMELFGSNMSVLMIIIAVLSYFYNISFFNTYKLWLIGSIVLFLLMAVYFEYRVYEYSKTLKNLENER